MDSFDKGWFVLQTYSGYENKVKENLLQRAQTYNMLENILRVEIPTQTVQVEKNGKTKEIEENRFPGYVLVEMVMTDEAWFVVRNTPNVTGFVGSHGNRSKPTPLLEDEIRNILISMGQTVQDFNIDVKVGDTVRIIDGAFTDYTGKITEIDNNKVKMIISMFGNDKLGRDRHDRRKRIVDPKKGLYAETHVTILKVFKRTSLVKCQLQTGRTHQIRVHLSHHGHPIMGDPLYNPERGSRLMLHAHRLTLVHPFTLEPIQVEALSQGFEEILAQEKNGNDR